MIELGFLGTGGATATADRDNASFLLSAGRKFVLIDCPGGAIQKIKKLGYDPLDLESIVITHIHPDHVYGLPSVFLGLMLYDGLIRLYGSEETVELCTRLLDLFGVREANYKTRAEFHVVRPGMDFKLSGLADVTAFEVSHHTSSLAYLFRFNDGRKFLYSGDTPADPSLLRQAGGLDVLCHDCSAPSRFFEQYPVLRTLHTSSLELGRLAQDARVKTLIPCHFFGEVEFSLAEIENEIRRHFTGTLMIPRDFDKIRF
jgi:ribonuclease Z